MNDDRRSGKTTQMLIRADEAKAEDRRVLIIVHEEHMISYCLSLVRVHHLGLIRRDFTTVRHAVQRRLRNTQKTDVFTDHAVWEHWTTDVDRLHDELEMLR